MKTQEIRTPCPPAFSARLDEMRQFIEAEKRRLSQLLLQVQETSEVIIAKQWLISPIRRAPVDILVRIFEHVLLLADPGLQTVQRKRLEQLRVRDRSSLASVSVERRDIILQTPTFWSVLFVDNDLRRGNGGPALKVCFERAKGSFRSLYVSAYANFIYFGSSPDL